MSRHRRYDVHEEKPMNRLARAQEIVRHIEQKHPVTAAKQSVANRSYEELYTTLARRQERLAKLEKLAAREEASGNALHLAFVLMERKLVAKAEDAIRRKLVHASVRTAEKDESEGDIVDSLDSAPAEEGDDSPFDAGAEQAAAPTPAASPAAPPQLPGFLQTPEDRALFLSKHETEIGKKVYDLARMFLANGFIFRKNKNDGGQRYRVDRGLLERGLGFTNEDMDHELGGTLAQADVIQRAIDTWDPTKSPGIKDPMENFYSWLYMVCAQEMKNITDRASGKARKDDAYVNRNVDLSAPGATGDGEPSNDEEGADPGESMTETGGELSDISRNRHGRPDKAVERTQLYASLLKAFKPEHRSALLPLFKQMGSGEITNQADLFRALKQLKLPGLGWKNFVNTLLGSKAWQQFKEDAADLTLARDSEGSSYRQRNLGDDFDDDEKKYRTFNVEDPEEQKLRKQRAKEKANSPAPSPAA